MNLRFWFAMVALALLTGCSPKPQSVQPTSNAKIHVDLLFEHDGVKVYRFSDGLENVYYTDARGRTDWTHTRKSGKTTIIEHHGVPTADDTVGNTVDGAVDGAAGARASAGSEPR